MVGEGARAGEPRAVLRQRRVEFLRIGDAGKADHRQYAEPARIAARRHARLQHRLVRRLEALGERRGLAAVADQEQRVGARHLLVERRPQGTGRHDEPIAEPGRGIDHDQAEILGELRVLEAVIHDDDRGVGAFDQSCARRAVRRHHGRRVRGKQQRLVADLRRALALGDQHRALRLAAIAAGEKRRALARFLQHFGDGNGRRGLAAAAGGEIADADHRQPRAVRRDAGHLPLRHAPVDGAERRQRRGEHASPPVPPEWRPKRHGAASPVAAGSARSRRWCAAALRPCGQWRPRPAPSCVRAPEHPQAAAARPWRDRSPRSPARSRLRPGAPHRRRRSSANAGR